MLILIRHVLERNTCTVSLLNQRILINQYNLPINDECVNKYNNDHKLTISNRKLIIKKNVLKRKSYA